MISKTHISAQKPRGRQLNAKVCGSQSAIFLILLSSDHYVLSRNFWSPLKNGPPGPSVTANFGPPLPQVVPPILHNGYDHWLTVSTVGVAESAVVRVYNSLYPHLTTKTQQQIAAIINKPVKYTTGVHRRTEPVGFE